MLELSDWWEREKGSQLLETGGLGQLGIIATQPYFQEADETSDHGLFPLGSWWEVYFDFVFEDVGVNPDQDLLALSKEDHVFIYYEIPVDSCQLGTCFNHAPSMRQGFVV